MKFNVIENLIKTERESFVLPMLTFLVFVLPSLQSCVFSDVIIHRQTVVVEGVLLCHEVSVWFDDLPNAGLLMILVVHVGHRMGFFLGDV